MSDEASDADSLDSSDHPLAAVLKNLVIKDMPAVEIEERKYVHHFLASHKFASIVTWQGGLTLTLKLKLHEVEDPLKLCSSRVEHGTWGVGEVQAHVTSNGQARYAVGLVRQAYSAAKMNRRHTEIT